MNAGQTNVKDRKHHGDFKAPLLQPTNYVSHGLIQFAHGYLRFRQPTDMLSSHQTPPLGRLGNRVQPTTWAKRPAGRLLFPLRRPAENVKSQLDAIRQLFESDG